MAYQFRAKLADRRHIAIGPDDHIALARAGRNAESRGDLADACSYHRRASAVCPLAHYFYELGNAQLLRGSPVEAMSAFRRAIELIPAEAPFLGNSGETLARLGLVDGAVRAHRRAVAIKPSAPLVLENLTQAWTRLCAVVKACQAGRA